MSISDPDGGNRLGDSSSPYLRQHADNPVHWQPWDEAALAEAVRRDLPILLSVGYSSCHWCHVMAHESFEDPATADVMNSLFVNIKVDREERPDIDRVYQSAHQILTQQTGGWPLTIFLDPHTRLPFFSGTYFPPTPRHGMPAFTELLRRVATVWQERRGELEEQGAKLQEIFGALNLTETAADDGLPERELLGRAREELLGSYDSAEGGFGRAPKFPMPSCIERLMRHWALEHDGGRDGDALDAAMNTLTRMARGGIFDHLGGGFCRYSTDRAWLVPHFEKMLYDNGALLALYADALAIAPDPLLDATVAQTADWLLQEMQAPGGAFFAALDADSEGEEGRFYVWHREQIRRLLDADEYLLIGTLYGVDKPANFEGSWILHRRDAWRAVVQRLSLEPGRAEVLLASARAKLLAARSERERPGRDDKILTAWNALAITGLARASRRTGERRWLEAARAATDFIREHMMPGGVLHASWIDGELGQPAYLEDVAGLLEALLELLATDWRDADLRLAVQLAETLMTHHQDDARGGFFQTRHDAETLIYRPKPTMDEALPAGNAVAARALSRLGHLVGEPAWIEAAANVLRWAAPVMRRAPSAHCAMLDALEEVLEPPQQVVIRGPESAAWARVAQQGYRPDRRVYALPAQPEPAPGAAAPLLPDWLPTEQPAETSAWICTGLSCGLPITSEQALKAALGGSNVVRLGG